ncbi:hypothetical protein [Pseudonocardia sp. N23]|uniref:hypothetical protein n=1 Tax=Pseudonocardia sp. N23 TaxID=1987376 RepID=UPI00114567CA|nr:hypothetical protein [Pseudonocardia sp. N23]
MTIGGVAACRPAPGAASAVGALAGLVPVAPGTVGAGTVRGVGPSAAVLAATAGAALALISAAVGRVTVAGATVVG